MNRKFFQRKNERGVALLLALGLLSLLLILGLAFVTNALVARQVSTNSKARSMAKVFALSALSRLQASMLLYTQQSVLTNTALPDSFDRFYSYENAGNNDQLLGSNSKLALLPTDDTVVSQAVAEKYNQLLTSWPGTWIKIYNQSTGTTDNPRKIIGRVAWQFVPSDAQILASVFFRGHMNSYHYRGARYLVGPTCISLSNMKAYLYGVAPYRKRGAATKENNWFPNSHRWGKEIDEIYLNDTSSFYDVSGTWSAGQDWKSIRVSDWDTTINALPKLSDDDADKRKAKKFWVKKWLNADWENSSAADPTPLTPETYTYKNSATGAIKRYPRFNISELFLQGTVAEKKYWRYFADKESGAPVCTDPWYARFGVKDSSDSTVTGRNDFDAIKNLTADSIDFHSTDVADWALKDGTTRLYNSLPFLRRIGKNKGSFNDLATLRKQIAANFNDYCDADDIPTSDAAVWSVENETETLKYPTFTGNEKTLYINELAFALDGLKFEFAAGSGKFAGRNIALKVSFPKIHLLAELVNIYRDAPTTADYRMQLLLKSLQMKIKPVVTYKMSYTYETGIINKTSHTIKDDTIEYDFSDTASITAFSSLNLLSLATHDTVMALRKSSDSSIVSDHKAELANFTAGTGNYFLEKKLLNEDYILGFASALDPSSNFEKYLAAKIKLDSGNILSAKLKSINSIAISKIEWKFEEPSVELGPALLEKKVSASQYQKADFVRFDRLGKMTAAGLDGFKKTSPGNTFTPDAAEGSFYLAGFQAIDPRQNLNPRVDTSVTPTKSTAASDWLIEPKLLAMGGDIPSMTAEGTGTDDPAADKISGGKVNTCSDPSVAASTRDKESATDPAWLGDDANQHLSTAFIRNAPMQSAWEIGLIHRGAAWQTINIKSAGDPDTTGQGFKLSGHEPPGDVANDANWEKAGTDYADGDGAILDQIKLSEYSRTYGKINVNLLSSTDSNYQPEYDIDIVKALFCNIRLGQSMTNFYAVSTRNTASGDNQYKFPVTAEDGTAISAASVTSGILEKISKSDSANRPFGSRAQFVNWSVPGGGDDCLANGFGIDTAYNSKNDAAQEELVGKTIGLLTAENVLPNVIQIVVVAQTIDDRQGKQYLPNATPGGDPVSCDCTYGKFDAYKTGSANYNSESPQAVGDEDNNYYFDRITGEVKMFVTLDRDPTTGRMSVRRIDYLD